MPDLDHPTIPTCPTCGALPEFSVGVVASVTFTADGTATITVDLDQLDEAADDGDWAFACNLADGEEPHDDPEDFTEASHDLAAYLADVAANCAPAMDYTIGSGANRA